MKKIELLAPAGNLEKAKTAFMYGADAVYAGTSKLSLRTRAEMNIDELEEIIKYAHNIEKKVYVALNIYAYDEDYIQIKKEIQRLKQIDVDAIIASDCGIIEMIKSIAPEMEIHLSTQANTTSLQSSLFWYKNGVKRIILARELGKDKIEYILKNRPKDLEFEIFAHGAICFAYSGRCYLSQYLSDRSANHGDCSQPCRWQYKVTAEEVNTPGSFLNVDYDKNGTYIFSSKDLCLIKQIPSIIEMNVNSIKIEGRLKTEYYLATIVRAYRNAIDEYYIKKEEYGFEKYLEELEKVKTRGLSEFYYTNSNNLDINDFDGMGAGDKYEFGGKIIKKIEPYLYLLEIRNKIIKGDKLEIMLPDKFENIEYIVDKMYDSKTKQKIEFVNPGTKGKSVLIELKVDLKEGYIIRRVK